MRQVQTVEYYEPRDCISHDWMSSLREWNMQPLLVPNLLADVPGWLATQAPDLIILTGGGNIDEQPERNSTELALVDHAMHNDIPILGVCRGMQFLNTVRFGGNLTPKADHSATTHPINIAPPFKKIFGANVNVNSYHDFGISPEGLGEQLEIFAKDPDGWVEGFYLPGSLLVGVMWHPERSGGAKNDRNLLQALIRKTL